MSASGGSAPLNEHEQQVLAEVIGLNTRMAAVSTAIVAGAAVWLATAILLWKGGFAVGRTLAILSTFFPGYSVSWTGAFVGLLWGGLFGAISGGLMYSTYARTLRHRIERQLASAQGMESLRTPTFLLSGNGLGIGLGITIAAQQFVLTNWLVLRGTANQSVNAALLGEFLPGYRVSFVGSLIGGVELFAVTYGCATLVAWLYNGMARRRRAIDR